MVCDPHHLPRWWPRVERVEGVHRDSWTTVLSTSKGRPVRADFRLLGSERGSRLAWAQELRDTPFAKLLEEAVTEVRLESQGERTQVVIEQRHRLRGLSRFGGFMMRRATSRLLDEALDGLRAVCEG